jgi:pyruvate/2-oxoglutarate dehydrogenase complex dihydrolipoamide dehydrogenase (E3) component
LDNLEVKLNHKATMADIEALSPDFVINATGALPVLPPISGLKEQLEKEDRTVFSIFDLLGDMENFQDFEGKRIAVIGGGAVGLDVMEYYAERGAKEVHVVEMQSEVGKDLDLITQITMMDIAKEHGAIFHADTKLIKVNGDSFLVEKDGKEEEISFDLGFVCLGMRANAPMMDELQQFVNKSGATLVNIGDSKRARRIMEGTREARDVINLIHRKAEQLALKK